jgi:hypothetical protein
MSLIHILHTPAQSETPWWPSDERLELPGDERIWTDCCGCKMPAEQTVASYVSYFDYPHGGMGGDAFPTGRFVEFDFPTGAWYGGDWRIHCAEGCGCTVRPSKKNGRELREMWRWPL